MAAQEIKIGTMISVNNAVRIHNILIEKFGGKAGIRDQNMLDKEIVLHNEKNYSGNPFYPQL